MKRKNWFSATEDHLDSLMADSDSLIVRKVNFDSCSQSISPSKKCCSTVNRSESDRDSDYGGSDISESKGEVTTLRMLFERCRVSDTEFYESCLDIGLLSESNSKCKECAIESPLVEIQSGHPERLVRRCQQCKAEWSVKRDSWCENILVSLKELVLIVYCWCHGYSESLTAHEIEVDISIVSSLFIKCSSVAEKYYGNPISNIGGENKRIITDIFTYNNRTVLACMEKISKNTFYSILPKNYDENVILTLLIDNLDKGSSIITCESSQISKLLDRECFMYLKESWGISVIIDQVSQCDSLVLQWTEFEHLLPPADNFDPAYKNVNADSVLQMTLFKKRMENSKDSFLFFLTVVSQLYNTASVQESD